jgi:hypothetical protein
MDSKSFADYEEILNAEDEECDSDSALEEVWKLFKNVPEFVLQEPQFEDTGVWKCPGESCGFEINLWCVMFLISSFSS